MMIIHVESLALVVKLGGCRMSDGADAGSWKEGHDVERLPGYLHTQAWGGAAEAARAGERRLR